MQRWLSVKVIFFNVFSSLSRRKALKHDEICKTENILLILFQDVIFCSLMGSKIKFYFIFVFRDAML